MDALAECLSPWLFYERMKPADGKVREERYAVFISRRSVWERLPRPTTLDLSCEEVVSNSPYRGDGVRNDDEDAGGRSIRTQREGDCRF